MIERRLGGGIFGVLVLPAPATGREGVPMAGAVRTRAMGRSPAPGAARRGRQASAVIQAALGILALGSTIPVAVRAADGVREINQACVAVGCVAGDTPGFPVTINQPGSYRLTSDLSTAPNLNVHAIEISSPVVTLDLNGFSIIGPTNYGGPGSGTCPGGTGIGIFAYPNIPADSVTVTNGTVRGMGLHGVFLASNSRVENVIAQQNCGAGITVGGGSNVIDSLANLNGGNGIVLELGSRVSGSVAGYNGGNGIRSVNGDVQVQSCTTQGNTGDGINVGPRSMVRGNLVNGNSGDGIEVGSFSAILENVVTDNDLWGTRVGQNTTAALNTIIAGGSVGILGYTIGCNYRAVGTAIGTRDC